MIPSDIAVYMTRELSRANELYPLFSSPHEGYGIMAEEFQELFEEIRQKKPDHKRMTEEAVQLGAMCIKFIQSMEKWENTMTLPEAIGQLNYKNKEIEYLRERLDGMKFLQTSHFCPQCAMMQEDLNRLGWNEAHRRVEAERDAATEHSLEQMAALEQAREALRYSIENNYVGHKAREALTAIIKALGGNEK